MSKSMNAPRGDTITLELCSPEALAIVELIDTCLDALRQAQKTPAFYNEVAILRSLVTKLFVKTLPLALRDLREDQDRLN